MTLFTNLSAVSGGRRAGSILRSSYVLADGISATTAVMTGTIRMSPPAKPHHHYRLSMTSSSFHSTRAVTFGDDSLVRRCRIPVLLHHHQQRRQYTRSYRRMQKRVGDENHVQYPNQPNHHDLPLHGLKILDLSRVLAGPFATQILSDMGADVIKVENPSGGDETRVWRTAGETGQMWKQDPHHKEYDLMSLYFCAVNRNKRSLTLDLKTLEARDVIRKLVAKPEDGGCGYDVVVSNFVPGKLHQMGLGYETLKSWNSAVVLAEVSGYGASGPWVDRAGYDAVALAEAGLLHITGEPDGPPTKPGVAIADLCTGLYAHGAILAAVNARHRNGNLGCRIEGSLYESAVSLLVNVGLASLNLDTEEQPHERRRGKRYSCGHPNLVPYNRYQTKDGKWFFIAANNNRQWKLFCERLTLHDLCTKFATNDARVENRSAIDNALNERFNEKDMKEWLDIFQGSGLPYGPVNDVVDALEHPQAEARGMVTTIEDFEAAVAGVVKLIGPAVKFPGKSTSIRQKPPLLGEHTTDILAELGYGPQDIQRLKNDRIV